MVNINSSTLKSFVKSWMRTNAKDFVNNCNELDLTGLSELVAAEFDIYMGDELTIPEWVYEMAVDVKELDFT